MKFVMIADLSDSFSTSTRIESPKTQNILQIVKHSFALVLGSCNHRLPANSYHKILSFHGINEFHGINSTLSSMVCLYFYCLLYNVYLFIIQEKRGWVHSDNDNFALHIANSCQDTDIIIMFFFVVSFMILFVLSQMSRPNALEWYVLCFSQCLWDVEIMFIKKHKCCSLVYSSSG